MPKRKYTKRRVSKRRVSKRRVSKRRVSKKSKKKMKGGSLYNIAQRVAGNMAPWARKCKICGRFWKGHKDWIWKPGIGNDTTSAEIHFHDFIKGKFPEAPGICGYCNGNNMYKKLISENKTELQVKIKVIIKLINDNVLDRGPAPHPSSGDGDDDGPKFGIGEVLDKKLKLENLYALENAYRKLSLVKIFEEYKDIPIELCGIINNHLENFLERWYGGADDDDGEEEEGGGFPQ